MGQIRHGSATTTHAVRAAIQRSQDSLAHLTRELGINPTTAELHTFHGKIEQKAAWTRGLFVSSNGLTEDGLVAFGRGKRIICMDGLDLYEMLDREIPLPYVLERQVRRTAEIGSPFVRVRDLFLQ